jgi:hypothetical protein
MMSDPKLKAGFWVRATLRQCQSAGLNAVVVHKGDEDSGAIMIKVFRPGIGCELYTQTRDAQARLCWLRSTGSEPVAESKADQIIARSRENDGDLWVVEIETRTQGTPILENILGG